MPVFVHYPIFGEAVRGRAAPASRNWSEGTLYIFRLGCIACLWDIEPLTLNQTMECSADFEARHQESLPYPRLAFFSVNNNTAIFFLRLGKPLSLPSFYSYSGLNFSWAPAHTTDQFPGK